MLLKELQPQAVWEQFDALTRVPRPSKKEERVIEFLIDFAKRHHIEWQRDEIGNVVMRKPFAVVFRIISNNEALASSLTNEDFLADTVEYTFFNYKSKMVCASV